MHVAGHRQIQDLQLPVFGVLVLVVLVRQGPRPPAPGRRVPIWMQLLSHQAAKAQPAVDAQIADREQDVGAVLNDLTEQPLQGTAALVQARWPRTGWRGRCGRP